MKRRGNPQACPRRQRRVPRSAARCPWCLGAGVASGTGTPAGAPADAGATGSRVEPRKADLAT